MRSMGSRLPDTRKGVIFHTARVGILTELLLGVQLDDEHLVYGNIDLISLRQLADCALERLFIDINPLGCKSAGCNLKNILESLDALGFLSDLDHITGFDDVGRNVHDPAVDSDMLMSDNLTCLTACAGKAHAENDIVQAALKHGHKVFTGHALHPVGLVIVVAERLLKNAVDEFGFLLLAQLHAVLTELAASADQLSLGLLVVAQENGIEIERSASFQYRSSVYCHGNSSFLSAPQVAGNSVSCRLGRMLFTASSLTIQ